MAVVHCIMGARPHLCDRFTIIGGECALAFPGAFSICDHRNVTCISDPLEPMKDRLAVWCG